MMEETKKKRKRKRKEKTHPIVCLLKIFSNYVLCACMSVCGYVHVHVDAHGKQKKVPSGPEVKVVVSQRQNRCRNINWVLWKLLTAKSSL